MEAGDSVNAHRLTWHREEQARDLSQIRWKAKTPRVCFLTSIGAAWPVPNMECVCLHSHMYICLSMYVPCVVRSPERLEGDS